MTSHAASDLQFFDGFAWAVPTAFASALAALRFEQGDVVFRESAAYGPLQGTEAANSLAIQVLHPPRSARSMPIAVEGDRRRATWQSEVRIDLIDLATGKRETRTISQGKLLMTLWRGFQRFRWRREMGRQVQWVYLLVGLIVFALMAWHGTLGAQLGVEFGVHVTASQLLGEGASLREALP